MAEIQRVRNKAPSVCLSCRVGKRQCDKLLPSCSRCKKLNRECQYATTSPSSIRKTETDAETARLEHEESGQSCTRCKIYKRKCDRLLPRCSRCSRIAMDCEYGLKNIASPRSLPGCAESSIRIQYSNAGPGSYSLLGPRAPLDLPITYRPYMPMLLQFFVTSANLPPEIALVNSLKQHMGSVWVQHAMADACLFHATLFSASASIDILMGRQNNTVTLYHQTSTIRMLSERLNQETPLLNYGTLGSVLPLVFYNMVGLDQESAVLHQKGLVRMLLSIPKTLMDELGPLIAVIKLTMLSYSCVFDTPPVWDCFHVESARSYSIVRNLVSSRNFHKAGNIYDEQTIESILDVYEVISRLDRISNSSDDMTATQLEQGVASTRIASVTQLLETEEPPIDTISRVNACCRLCCLIFWELLRMRSQQTNMSATNEKVNLLLDLMTNIDYSFWIRKAPEAFTWITFTGAAGCIDANDRGAFIHRGSTILTAVDSEKLTLMTQGWKYFGLLRKVSGLRASPTDASCEEG